MSTRASGPTAALAGISTGLQRQGLWTGRRQLLVCFAAEAETATMYTPEALTRELQRSAVRSVFHSIAIAGWDPLGSPEFLLGAFGRAWPVSTDADAVQSSGAQGARAWPVMPPLMLDAGINRPDALATLAGLFHLIQVTVDLTRPAASDDDALEMLAAAARAGREHALAILAGESRSETELLRLVERARSASVGTKIVVHPATDGDRPAPVERRYASLIERAMAIHPDVRLVLRIPPPVGVR